MRKQAFFWLTGMAISPNNTPDGEKASVFRMPIISNMTDSEFHNYLHEVVTVVIGNLGGYGLTAEDVALSSASDTIFAANIAACVQIALDAKAATLAKNENRAIAEKNLRTLLNKITLNNGITPPLLQAVGISAVNAIPTPASAPTSYPEFHVDLDSRLHHVVHYHDAGNTTSRKKPAGVHAVEIWCKVGDPAPIGPSEMSFMGSDTATPWEKSFADSELGKPVYYALRWVSTRGEVGPWSVTIKSIVPG
jgi:hypothetical protein